MYATERMVAGQVVDIVEEGGDEENEIDQDRVYLGYFEAKPDYMQLLRILKPFFWPTSGPRQVVTRNRIQAILTWVIVIISKVTAFKLDINFDLDR